MFNPSIVIVWILLGLLGLSMLSAGLYLAISKVRAAHFITKMPTSLQFLAHEIVYFGILKYHLVLKKPRNGILPHMVGL